MNLAAQVGFNHDCLQLVLRHDFLERVYFLKNRHKRIYKPQTESFQLTNTATLTPV